MKDLAFYRACNDARDDAHYLGIHRTQEEIEREAERYRRLERSSS